jgi:hypothetical protein
LTVWDANDLYDYWGDYPPTHVLVAAYFMGGSRAGKRHRGSHRGNFDELQQLVASAGGRLKRKIPETYRLG